MSNTGYTTIHCQPTQRGVGVAWQRHAVGGIGGLAGLSLDLQCEHEARCALAQLPQCPLNRLRRAGDIGDKSLG